MKKQLLLLVLCMIFSAVGAQEIRATVSVNHQKLLNSTQGYETTDLKVFETMKLSIEDFVNGRRWTNLQVTDQEKIDMAIGLTLTQRSSATAYEAQLNIQMRRPVYNSTYTTGLFNYMETGFPFQYNENDPIDFDPNTYSTNLISAIAYYVYMMLGIYFDSYGPGGGAPFYTQAAQVAQTASGVSAKGWNAQGDSKARYWFVENHTNNAYEALHAVYYNYHRLGLDRMTQNQEEARAKILEALQQLQLVNNTRRNLLSVTQFVDVKIDEIISIFTPAEMEQKQQVYDIIRSISPVNVSKMSSWGINTRNTQR